MMKSVIRNFLLVLRRFRVSSVINVLGLSAAIAVAVIVAIQVRYDFGYGKQTPGHESVFQLLYHTSTAPRMGWINQQIPTRIAAAVPEVEAFCLTRGWGLHRYDVQMADGVREGVEFGEMQVTPGFWQVFGPKLVAGDTTDVFSVRGNCAIPRSAAERLFSGENPVGRTLVRQPDGTTLTVRAVYEDFAENAGVANALYTRMPELDASEYGFFAFFLVQPGSAAAAVEKMNAPEWVDEIFGADHLAPVFREHPERRYQFELATMNDMYLRSDSTGGRRIDTTLSLLAFGVLTLLVAFINFINLSLAAKPARVREINIRKVLGESRGRLQAVIASESVIFCLAALVLTLLYVHLAGRLPVFGEFFAADLAPQHNVSLIAWIATGVLIAAALLGWYSARYVCSFGAAIALKGSFAMGKAGNRLRNILVTFQFAAAIAFICIAWFIRRQHDYMQDYSWGIRKDHVVWFDVDRYGGNHDALGQELLRDPRIEGYTTSRALPGSIGMSWGRNFEGRSIEWVRAWSVHPNFVDFFGIRVVAGEAFDPDPKVPTAMFNRKFLERYDFDESLVGKEFEAFEPSRITGIIEDVNFESLHEPINPLVLAVIPGDKRDMFMVRLTGEDMPGAIRYIQQVWARENADPLPVRFLDEHMDSLYRRENGLSRLIGLIGLAAVLIAVMGVCGLVVFNTQYRIREIGIRKVNGATVGEILVMLNRRVLWQVGVAFAVACPVAWYVTNRWLDNFAYRIDLSWWVFAAAGGAVLLLTLISVTWQSWRAARMNPVESLKSE